MKLDKSCVYSLLITTSDMHQMENYIRSRLDQSFFIARATDKDLAH